MSEVYCFKCGEQIEDKFCSECGIDFDVMEALNSDDGIEALARPAIMANASSGVCMLCGNRGNPFYFLLDPDNIDTPVHLHCVRQLLTQAHNK